MRTVRTSVLCAALVAAWVALPGACASAHADEPPAALSVEALREEMHLYLRQEKRGGAVLMALGASGVALGGGLLAQDRAVWRGFAYPVLAIGVLELIGGVVFYARTNRQMAQLDRGLTTRPGPTRDAELKRMRRINLQFALIEALEMTLLVGGITTAAVGAGIRDQTALGVGLGLSLQSAALLTFDLFASRRALRYTKSLEHMQLSVSPSLAVAGPGGSLASIGGGGTVSLSGSF